MEIFQNLNEKGSTIVMVTHETDIAQFAISNVVFRDGRIIANQPVKGRKNATEELKNLPVDEDDRL
jgi:putative ABC transport system ATP-binding protein